MARQKFLLLSGFVFSFFAMHAQLIVQQHVFSFSRMDHENCSSQNLEIIYPDFYFKNGKPVSEVNDSIQKILRAEAVYLDEIFDFSSFTNSSDTSIQLTDTLTVFNCDSEEFRADEGALAYTVSINNRQLLSFAITSSFYAGGDGVGSTQSIFPLCYDLEEKKWMNLSALFQDKYDTLLVHKTDSLYCIENRLDPVNEEQQLTFVTSIETGRLVLYYSDPRSGQSSPHEINIPYKEFRKHLSRPYRKLLQPLPVKQD